MPTIGAPKTIRPNTSPPTARHAKAGRSGKTGRRVKRVALVGNAPQVDDYAAEIDAADLVVRINNAHGLGGATGERTTCLFLVNSGGQMREWLDDPAFTRRRAFRDARHVLLPIDPAHLDLFDPPLTPAQRSGARAEDWTREATARFTAAGKRVTLVPAETFARVCAEIGTPLRAGFAPPSTGLIAAAYILDALGSAGCEVDAYGFGFEGADIHAWSREAAWFHARHAEGALTLHPLRRPVDGSQTSAAAAPERTLSAPVSLPTPNDRRAAP